MSVIPVTDISYRPCWRIIPSRYPPADLFKRIAPPDDWGLLADIETRTNERVRQSERQVNYVRPDDLVTGPGSSLIMAPFTHPDPNGDYFTDGTFGVCFAAPTFAAALEWSVRRREDFLRSTDEASMTLQMRVLNMDLSGPLHDLRGPRSALLADTQATREIGQELRERGSFGVIYDGSLAFDNTNIAVFRPSVLSNCRQERHLAYQWNGERIYSIYDFSNGQAIPRP